MEYKKIIKIPGFQLHMVTNSPLLLNRTKQIVNHENLKDNQKSSVIDLRYITDLENHNLLDIELVKVNNIASIHNTNFYESNGIRTIIKYDNENSKRIIAIITRDLINGNFKGEILKDDLVATGFTMNMLEIHLAGMLVKEKYIPLHAAGVILNDIGLCLVGKSGAGKSSTTIKLLSQGASLISNDFLCVDIKSPDINSYSLDSTVALRKDIKSKNPSLWTYWEELTNGKETFSKENSEQKYFLADKIIENKFVPFGKLKFIAFISINKINKLEVRKLKRKEAFVKYLENKINVPPQLRSEINVLEEFNSLYDNCIFVTLLVPKWNNTSIENTVSKDELINKLYGRLIECLN